MKWGITSCERALRFRCPTITLCSFTARFDRRILRGKLEHRRFSRPTIHYALPSLFPVLQAVYVTRLEVYTMISVRRTWFLLIALAVLLGGTRWATPATRVAAAPSISTLVAIRAATHPTASPRYDRVVFQFNGPVPLIEVAYVKQLVGGGSGLPVPISGNSILQVTMRAAQAHDDQGRSTAPTRLKFTLPNVKEVASASDFEAVLTYGVGLTRKSEIRVLTLADPSRVVVDFLNP
jgi:hypothetical protein